jgi:spore coat polysaccharide biosynthesis protein SpsF
MKVAVVVQARLASHRLPGKVLLDLEGAPVLERMMERVMSARTPFEAVVATSHDPSCDEIEALCQRRDLRCFRGHPTDLLDRHLGAARSVGADVVVKIPSDCPLIDPLIIDRVLGTFLDAAGELDFVSNLHPPSYPDGNDVEVMTREALEAAHREAVKPYEREHTTPFIWDRPDRFRLRNVTWETGLDYSKSHRFTLDYLHDYHFIRAVYAGLWADKGPTFGLQDILALLERSPEIHKLNARWLGDCWQQHHISEFRNRAALGARWEEDHGGR